MRQVAMTIGLTMMTAGFMTAFLPAHAHQNTLAELAGGGGDGERGPLQNVECGGYSASTYTRCDSTSTVSCTPTTCS